ncbi:MAG: alpha-xylosidase, partial [Clostridia bacterium]|nr:alpha-xylosidase [Clostridia bacterium]
MKFTNGYWLNKPEYDLHFAIQSFDATITESALRIICPTVPAQGRGGVMNHPALTVTFTAPMEDVIRVKVEHWRGVVDRGPHFELHESPVRPVITETETEYTFQSGRA